MNDSYYNNICDAFSKNKRTFIMGLAIIWVVFHHIDGYYRQTGHTPPLFIAIFNLGYLGVDLFFLLSAYGLTASLNNNCTKKYYKNRFTRIYPNCILFLAILYLFFNPCDGKTIITESLLQLTGLSLYKMSDTFSTGFSFDWYSPAILTIYLVFPLFNKLIYGIYKRGQSYILITVFLLTMASVVMYRVCHLPFLYLGYRIPVLFVGGLFYYLIRDKQMKTITILLCFMAILSQLVYYDRLSYSLLSPILLFAIAFLLNYCRSGILLSVLKFAGKYSYEIYLSHIFIIAMYLPKYGITNIFLWIVITIVGSLVILLPFFMLNKYILPKIK